MTRAPSDPINLLFRPSLNTLLLIAASGSFSGAARRLGMRQSTVSRQVQSLEDEIGVSLFERNGAGIRPTDAGKQFIRQLEQIANLAQAAIDEARDFGAVRTGRLRLGFIGSFASSPAKEILMSLRELHPGLNIVLSELGSTELIRQVLAHQLDCAWVVNKHAPDSILISQELWSEPLYLALPATQRCGETIRWSALSGQILLARPEVEVGPLFQVLERAGMRPPEVQIHDCSRESLVSLVANGQGVTIVPESFARAGRTRVRFARIDEAGAKVAVCVVYRRDRDNPALRRLLAVTRDLLPGGGGRVITDAPS